MIAKSPRQIWDSIMNRPVFVTQNQIWKHLFWAGFIAGFVIGFILCSMLGVLF